MGKSNHNEDNSVQTNITGQYLKFFADWVRIQLGNLRKENEELKKENKKLSEENVKLKSSESIQKQIEIEKARKSFSEAYNLLIKACLKHEDIPLTEIIMKKFALSEIYSRDFLNFAIKHNRINVPIHLLENFFKDIKIEEVKEIFEESCEHSNTRFCRYILEKFNLDLSEYKEHKVKLIKKMFANDKHENIELMRLLTETQELSDEDYKSLINYFKTIGKRDLCELLLNDWKINYYNMVDYLIKYINKTDIILREMDKIRERDKNFDLKARFILRTSCKKNNLEVAKFAIEELKIDVEDLNNKKETPIITAIKNKSNEVVNYLIDKKVNLNILDYDGNSLLNWAAYSGDLDLFKTLHTTHKLDPEYKNNFGNPPIYDAVTESNLDVVRYLIEIVNIPLDTENNYGDKLIHMAAESASLEVFKYLVEQVGLDIFENNELIDKSVMEYAITESNLDVIKYLIETIKVPLDTENDDGDKLIHMAAESASLEVFKYLVEQVGLGIFENNDVTDESVMEYALNLPNLEIIPYLLANGFNFNDIKTYLFKEKADIESAKHIDMLYDLINDYENEVEPQKFIEGFKNIVEEINKLEICLNNPKSANVSNRNINMKPFLFLSCYSTKKDECPKNWIEALISNTKLDSDCIINCLKVLKDEGFIDANFANLIKNSAYFKQQHVKDSMAEMLVNKFGNDFTHISDIFNISEPQMHLKRARDDSANQETEISHVKRLRNLDGGKMSRSSL